MKCPNIGPKRDGWRPEYVDCYGHCRGEERGTAAMNSFAAPPRRDRHAATIDSTKPNATSVLAINGMSVSGSNAAIACMFHKPVPPATIAMSAAADRDARSLSAGALCAKIKRASKIPVSTTMPVQNRSERDVSNTVSKIKTLAAMTASPASRVGNSDQTSSFARANINTLNSDPV